MGLATHEPNMPSQGTQNGITERFHRSLKTEAFKGTVPISLAQARKISNEYRNYYNHHRPHQGIQGEIPKKSNETPKVKADFIKKEHLGGKITSFEIKNRRAA